MSKPSGWHRKRKDTAAERARNAEYASPAYRAQRRALKVEVDAGRGFCWRCGGHIPPGAAWHLGHDDHDRSIIRGAEHPRRSRSCIGNLSAAARKGARIRNAAPTSTGATQVRL